MGMVGWLTVERNLKEEVVAKSRYYPGIYMN
jgi:hypothetical protein